jgi:hypothetical protein
MATTTKGSQMNIYPEITSLESVLNELKNIMILVEDRAITEDEAKDEVQSLRANIEDIVSDLDI